MRDPRARRLIPALLSLAMVFSLLTVPAAAAPAKIDVWDFGAEQLDESRYNNRLTVEEINSWYPGTVVPGSEGNTIASFTTSDGALSFSDGGKPATHRLRTTNTALTRRDAKSLEDAAGTVYSGYLYSNSGSNPEVYVALELNAGDTVTVIAGSNGGDSQIDFEGPSGVEASQQFLASGAKAQALVFYPRESGRYKLYSTNEKLVVARIYRESAQSVAVSGSVSEPAGLSGYSVAFTNRENGAVISAAVSGGKYAVQLPAPFQYDVSLLNASGYVLKGETTLTLDGQSAGQELDLTVEAVPLVTVTGRIAGLDDEALGKLELVFQADAVYVPQVVLSGDSYTATLAKGDAYTVSALGVNDYALTSAGEVSYSADASADITFAPKPTHKVTLVPDGVDNLSGATLTFTNLDEEGYVYTFAGTDAITLRDGRYAVKAAGPDGFRQKLTSDLVVSGSDVSKTVAFAPAETPTKWDFSAKDFTGGGYTDASAEYSYNGLKFQGGQINKTYLLMKQGKVSIPVPGPCQVVVSACYEYSFYFQDPSEASVGQKTSSTSKIESFTYDYTGAAGTVELTSLGSSYLTSIELVGGAAAGAPYRETLTVGKSGCDYQSVSAAVAAVGKMDRPNGERVTISIQPGNYEEMLVVDVPNVTLVNASPTPSTAVTGKGVDIDPNAVRITWYYGHGYNYYSMGSDCKYDAELLAVNKENGRASFANPGAGTTDGSYWNSTAVISADGFQARGIIFENSFNQYISQKSLEDVIEPNGGQKEGAVPRAELKTAGDTTVQDKAYVERAGALAIANDCKNIYFENCKFIGRQDTLFGGAGATAAFYDCQVVGSTDYIYGGMTAVFAKCELVFNTSENSNDRGYITAPQQTSGRGYLMYNCTVTSTTPGVDTASAQVSKPGYFGRPWTANTGEAVFYETVVGTASDGTSLIHPDGWLNTLSGQSALCGEYNTHELTAGVDNSGARAAWAGKFSQPQLADGTPISVESFLGSWDPFAGKDMTVTVSGGTGFSDVSAGMYCAGAVNWAVANNVTKGTGPAVFSPAQTCTVKEILTFLWRAEGSPASAAPCPFQNVDSAYAAALSWAGEKGLIGEETTSADQPCSRAMACTYLWRLAGAPEQALAGFSDVPASAGYAQAVAWAVAGGITNGTGEGGFSPDRVCSRGEIITFLYRDLVKSL